MVVAPAWCFLASHLADPRTRSGCCRPWGTQSPMVSRVCQHPPSLLLSFSRLWVSKGRQGFTISLLMENRVLLPPEASPSIFWNRDTMTPRRLMLVSPLRRGVTRCENRSVCPRHRKDAPNCAGRGRFCY